MKDNTTLSNNQIYQRLYQEILNIGLEPTQQFFDICRNLYSPQRCIDILHVIKVEGYLPIQYKMWLTND